MSISKKTYYGSGSVYSGNYSESTFPKFADPKNITQTEAEAAIKFVDEIMTADNQIGYLKDGYEFKMETSTLSDKSDLGEMKVDAITDEKATVNFKLFNANGETIAKQYPTATHSKEETTGFGFTLAGGINNIDETPHVVIFRHKDNKYGDTVLVCIGKNTSGFEAIWKQNSVTPFPVSYAVEPFDDTGHLMLMLDCKTGHVWAVDSKSE